MAENTEMSLDNLTFDFDKVSAQDMWDFEEHSGGLDLMDFAEELKRGKITEKNFFKNLKPIVAIAWIIVRQKNPAVTFEEVSTHPMLPLFTAIRAVSGKESQLQPLAATKPAKRQTKAVPAS